MGLFKSFATLWKRYHRGTYKMLRRLGLSRKTARIITKAHVPLSVGSTIVHAYIPYSVGKRVGAKRERERLQQLYGGTSQ